MIAPTRKHLLLALLVGLAHAPQTVLAQQPASPAASVPANTVRPELGKLMQEVDELMKAGKAADALARLVQAEALPSPTPFEAYAIQRTKGRAAIAAGELKTGIAAFETILPSPLLPAADRLPITTVLAQASYQVKDYPRAVRWLRQYAADGGNDAQVRQLLPNALYLAEDHAGVVAELAPRLLADQAAGRDTPETVLRMLAASQGKVNDMAGYLRTLERIAVQGGKPEHWGELITRSLQGVNLGERYRLDMYRLRQATGNLNRGEEALEMAYLALQAGLPAEADAVLKDATARSLIAAGANTTQAQQLRQQAARAMTQDAKSLADGEAPAQAAKDGNALVNLGFALVSTGQVDKGATLMAQGVAKGGLRRADEAMMHLGIAQWRAGKAEDAAKSFAAVTGGDGGPELARLWLTFVRAKGVGKS